MNVFDELEQLFVTEIIDHFDFPQQFYFDFIDSVISDQTRIYYTSLLIAMYHVTTLKEAKTLAKHVIQMEMKNAIDEEIFGNSTKVTSSLKKDLIKRIKEEFSEAELILMKVI